MTSRRRLAVLALSTISALFLATVACAELARSDVEQIVRDYLAAHPEVVEQIVKDYLSKNPDAVANALAEIVKRRLPAAATRSAEPDAGQNAAVQKNGRQLFNSTHQVSLGNPQGDVTLVEFFDYNCGYCKRALGDMLALLRDDAQLRIVLKELPILGSRSVDAARVSIAVRMQDAAGQRYLDFHRRLLGAAGAADKAAAIAAANDVGFDVAQIERDLSSDEVRETLEESSRLARDIGIRGTPGYVVGTTVVPGAIGVASLKQKIATMRNKPGD